jgi:hypothetical protein
MAKFDIDKFVENYKKEYEKLPDDTEGTGRLKKPSKKTEPDDKEIRKRIEAVLKDNQDNTACTSCPLNGKCRRINWKGDLTWVKVTGCSRHPDQKKFKGQSTTIVITDSTVSSAADADSDVSFAAARAAATSTGITNSSIGAYIYEDSGSYYITRGCLYFDTTSLPVGAVVSAAKYSLYVNSVYEDNGNADNVNLVKGNTAPHSPVVVADYNLTKYDFLVNSATVARGDLSSSAYNDWALSSPFGILVPEGYTLGMLVYSDDQDGNAPKDAIDTYGINVNGSSNVSPPKLSVTYDLPSAFNPRSLNKKQMVI